MSLSVKELAELVTAFSRQVDLGDQSAVSQLENIIATERSRRDAYTGFFETAYDNLLASHLPLEPSELAARAACYAECALIVWEGIAREALARAGEQVATFEAKLKSSGVAKQGLSS